MNIDELAESQYGVITRAQAAVVLSANAIDRRLASKRWIPLFPGVYRLAGAPQMSLQRVYAAAVWANGHASHLTAAKILRLDAMPQPMWIDLTVDRATGLRGHDVVVHRSSLPRIDRIAVDGIACTSATRTLVDCARFVDGETLEMAFEDARRLGLTSVRAIEQRIGRGRPGSAALRDVLTHVGTRAKESRLEVKLARLLRRSGLARPVPQFEIGEYRVDFAWPSRRVVCECDGFAWHGNRLEWKRDRRRVAAIEASGWRVMHITWDDVTQRADETLSRVELALAATAA